MAISSDLGCDDFLVGHAPKFGEFPPKRPINLATTDNG